MDVLIAICAYIGIAALVALVTSPPSSSDDLGTTLDDEEERIKRALEKK